MALWLVGMRAQLHNLSGLAMVSIFKQAGALKLMAIEYRFQGTP